MRADGRLLESYYQAVSVPKLTAFLQSQAALRMAEAARAGRLHKEQPFVMGIPANLLKKDFPAEETVLIQGIIDVFFEEDDGYVVLDYKTDAVDRGEELVNRYKLQLEYYAQALEQLSGYRDTGEGMHVKEKIIYSFKLGEEIPV
jgi:ATP-dependent helicase/nuclease subunit A